LVTMTSAGHPPPLWYRAARDEWSWLQTRRASEPGRPAGAPLGLLADVSYDQLVIKPQPGDLILLYSDGVSEATNPAGNELGLNGLMNMARALDCNSPEALGIRLTSALHAFRGGAEPLDDETIIVMRRNGKERGSP
jgi:phosphoserine phosphatase RsbU/P